MKRVTASRLLWIASGLLIVHGAVELLSVLRLFDRSLPPPTFSFEQLARSPEATAGVGIVSGLLRLSAAVGILANREWGWVLRPVRDRRYT